MSDFGQLAPWLAPLLGSMFQQLRAYRKFPEWVFWVLTLAAGVGCMWLWNDGASMLTKVFWQKNLGMLVLWISGVVGGTFGASSLAKAGAPAALAPMTDSK